MSDDTPLVIGSASGPAVDDAHLDAAVRVTLPWTTAALAVLASAAALIELLNPERIAPVVLVLALAAGLELGVTLAAYRWRRRLPVPDAWAAAGVTVLAGAGIAAIVLADDAAWSALVLLAVTAVGVAVITLRWLIAVLYAVWVGWLAGLAAADLPSLPMEWLLALAGATVLAVLASSGRRRVVEALHTAEDVADQVSVRDPLTGLVNRRGLALLGSQIVEAARRQGDAVHCVFIDIDQLRHVNNVLGHDSGDEVLVAVADSLRAVTRATDVVARWGGDEFAILGPGAGMAPMELERRVRERIRISPPVPDDVWSPRVVAGGAMLAPWDSGSLDTLLGKADQEMYLRRALRKGTGAGPRPSATRSDHSPVDPGN